MARYSIVAVKVYEKSEEMGFVLDSNSCQTFKKYQKVGYSCGRFAL